MLLTLLGYVFLCILCTVSALPLIGVLTFFGGFSFGILPAVFTSLIGQAIGSILTFVLGSYLLKDSSLWFTMRKKLGVSDQNSSSGTYYLFILRLFPFITSWIVSLGASTLGVSLKGFVFATILGKLPINLLYAWWGQAADLAIIKSEGLNLSFSSHPELWWPFFCILLLGFAPVLYKKRGVRVS